MDLRRIASTGLLVSPLGLGTVKLGRTEGVKYPSSFTVPDDRAAAELLSAARSMGINLIDTAPAYGTSEERLGRLLQGQRQDWVICTKAGEEFDGSRSSFDFTPEHIRRSVVRSLGRLQTDWLDMVLIHSDGNDLEIIRKHGALDTLRRLKDEGLIRAFGMSTKTVEGGLLAASLSDAVMVAYNPDYRDEERVIDSCRAQGKAVLVKKAFSSGHLCLQGESAVQNAMDFIFAHSGVTSVIVGTIDPKHLSQNVAAAEKAILRLA